MRVRFVPAAVLFLTAPFAFAQPARQGSGSALASRGGDTTLAPAKDSAAPDAENAPADDMPIPVPPVPPRIANSDQYDRCMDMLADDPSGADALATAWRGGGEAAAHCHALAQIELGNPAAGAALLTTLAGVSQANASARAEVFGQAAQAWTMAGDATRAFEAATQAVTLAPEDPDLRVIHAIAAVAVHRDAMADEDLSDALDADPKRTDALVLRASVRRHMGEFKPAEADIDRALEEDSDDADALLERGILRQRLGDLAGARADWEKVEDISPDSASGDLAQQNLALLEAGPLQ